VERLEDHIINGLQAIRTYYLAEDLATLLLLHLVVLADELAVAINIGRKPRRWARDFTDSVEEARKYRRGRLR